MLHPSVWKSWPGWRHAVAGAAVLAAGVSAHAQQPPLDRQIDETFRQVMQQPQDAQLLARYARLLVQAGNFEGGIAALERLLLEPGARPELKVEVAQYYWRLGSYGMAERLVSEALQDPRLQGGARVGAEQLLREARKRNQRNQFSGAVVAGLRHQSNPAYRTSEALVYSGGALAPPAATQRPRSDNDWSIGLNVRHEFDLDRQDSATIASTLSAYLVDFRSASGSTLVANPTTPYDLGLLDATVGLRFRPAPRTWSHFTLRPHVVLTYLSAQGHDYLRNAGLGLDAGWQAGERTQVTATLDSVHRDFANRIDVPNADQLDGRLTRLRARISHEWRPLHTISGELTHYRNRSGRSFYDYDTNEVRASYAMAYRAPLDTFGGQSWTTTLWAAFAQRDYDAPDPTVNPLVERRDRESRVGVQQTIGFADAWSLVLTLEHARSNSSLPNFQYRNTSFFAGVSRSF